MCFWVLKPRVSSVPGGSILCIFLFRMTPFLFHNLPGVCCVVWSQVFCVAPWFGPDRSSLIAFSLESLGLGRGRRERQYFQWLWIIFAAVAPLLPLVEVGLSRCRHWQPTPYGDDPGVQSFQTGLSFPTCVSLSYGTNIFQAIGELACVFLTQCCVVICIQKSGFKSRESSLIIR